MELRERIAAVRPIAEQPAEDAFAEVRDRVHTELIADLGPQLANAQMEPALLREPAWRRSVGSRPPTESGSPTRSRTTPSVMARSRSSSPTIR
jgi:hypothetical protein